MTTEPIEGEVIGREVAVIEPPSVTLFQTDEPEEVVEKATKVATALANVVRAQKLANVIQGKEYVRVEGWTLLGSMLGVFPVEDWTRPVAGREGPKGQPHGWEARVEARRGELVVGAAEAMCTRDEKRWADADDYAIRSMAQTRATAKALRMPLGFVMQLAGYAPTPAEEMTFAEDNNLERAVAPITEKQRAFISKMLHDLYDRRTVEEVNAFAANLCASYPAANVDGKFVVRHLTMGEAWEVITLLKETLK